jgi:hypothetical protein
MKIDRVLREMGQFVFPMTIAPRDGRKILGVSERDGLITCFWDQNPRKLTGPAWLEEIDAEHGYLDKAFVGFLEPAAFRSIDRTSIYRLLVAYVDESRAAGDPLTMLEDTVKAEANDR